MLKLIVGLGNPGQQYEKTRHNAGFLFLDGLAVGRGAAWSLEKRFQGMVAHIVQGGNKIWLLKPQTFMNRSGQSVRKIADFYKISSEEILVVHDELDFEPGIIKLKKAGGHNGHNGLRDIIAYLGVSDFWRLRIGIGRSAGRQTVADYVLSNLSVSDKMVIGAAIERVYASINLVIDGDTGKFMALLH
jgi:PTH1 family peptidyl-tRNA hydrolase